MTTMHSDRAPAATRPCRAAPRTPDRDREVEVDVDDLEFAAEFFEGRLPRRSLPENVAERPSPLDCPLRPAGDCDSSFSLRCPSK